MNTPLPSPEEMARWDQLAINEFGVSGEILMENASREALHVLLQAFGPVRNKKVTLFAGSGNNGGDAFALARHLSDHGAQCLVLYTREPDKYQGESAWHLQLCKKSQVSFAFLPEYNLDLLPQSHIVVDGLLGTGFQGELRQDYQEWIRYINRLSREAFVLALDIPSGLNGRTGEPGPVAVQAQVTVTFGACKLGLFLPQAAKYLGQLHTRQIGIPAYIPKEHPPACYGLQQSILDNIPRPENMAHKGTFGHVLILGGSQGLSGAPVLAALGALRSGAGLVTVGCPRNLVPEIKQGWPEIMTLPLGPSKSWSAGWAEELESRLELFDAVVLGPGLGREDGSREFMQAYLDLEHPGTVFDADALYWLAQEKKAFDFGSKSILTPHPGEMARICGLQNKEVQQNRLHICQEQARTLNAVLVLKGAGTVISAPGQSSCISPFACPSLAIGGSGDVLAGVAGSMLARGLDPMTAACTAVYWHGLAGQRLMSRMPCRGNLAQEIAHELPFCLQEPDPS